MKKVAGTLVNILDTDHMQAVLDRSKDIQPVIDDMTAYWSFDLYTRKPGAAYTEDGAFQGTDLDLACFLFALSERGAVINIPEYTSRRPKQVTEGEVIVSDKNRHGKILGLTANQETLSFSIRINDANVMTTDSIGNFRNFMLVDVDGKWHDGWKTIQFVPTAKENDFLNDKKLWSDNSVVFKNFIHPNRWISFYGQYYFITKALIVRLTEEAKFLKDTAEMMRKRGVKIGGGPGGGKKEWPKKTVVGDAKSITIKAFQAEVDHPDFMNDFTVFSCLPQAQGKSESEILKLVEDRARAFTYNIIPKLRFVTRATEYAFFFNSNNGDKMPSWIENAKWDRAYVIKGKKNIWSRLVFARGIALRYRVFDKKEQVAAD